VERGGLVGVRLVFDGQEGQGGGIVGKATPTEPIGLDRWSLKGSTALLRVLLAIPEIPGECVEEGIGLEDVGELAE
jgi:hypothetical protein